MDYYKLLQLQREPFSNSPDPDYFFQSRQHLSCMQKLELALRLKRGLNVVIGDVGTGKTTLCRQLIRNFSKETHIESHLILDPTFAATLDFLIHIHELICGSPAPDAATQVELKERIKQALFSKGVDQGKTIVLIIDEGQKITEACVEILRELLNFETNTFKLLQIVIFAQLEFNQIIQKHANFSDRINVLHHLAPMNFKDTREMIYHRLKLSSSEPKPKMLFTYPAIWAIYRASQGYPRKIIHLCHQSLLAMIIQNRSKAGWSLIRSCKKRISPVGSTHRRFLYTGLAALLAVAVAVAYAPRILNHEPATTESGGIKIYEEKILSKFMADAPLTAIANPPGPGDIPDTTAIEEDTADTAPPGTFKQAPPQEASFDPPAASGIALEPAVDPPAADTSDSASPPDLPPESLGKLIVKPGDTLVAMVHRVYGTFNNRHLKAVIEANAQIEDPNRIDIGNIIEFPSLPFRFKPRATPVHWVVLEEYETLPSAVQRIDRITKTMRVPLQLMSTWSPVSGLRFQVLVKGYFKRAHEATAYIQALPEEISANGDVRFQWSEEAILYSNPYGSGAH